LGPLWLATKAQDDIHLKYREASEITQGYDWNLGDMEQLVKKNCDLNKDLAANPNKIGESIWVLLSSIAWKNLYDASLTHPANWTKVEWKYWMTAYIDYTNALDAYRAAQLKETARAPLDLALHWLATYDAAEFTLE